MSYLEENLLPNERILYKAKIHPIVYLPGGILLFFGLLLTMFGLTAKDTNTNVPIIYETFCYFPIFAIFGATLFALIKAILQQISTEFGVTNYRLIIKTGFIQRNILELLISKIESANVNQKVFGRLLNYGSIAIIGTGGSSQAINYINNPVYVRKVILNIYQKYKDQ